MVVVTISEIRLSIFILTFQLDKFDLRVEYWASTFVYSGKRVACHFHKYLPLPRVFSP